MVEIARSADDDKTVRRERQFRACEKNKARETQKTLLGVFVEFGGHHGTQLSARHRLCDIALTTPPVVVDPSSQQAPISHNLSSMTVKARPVPTGAVETPPCLRVYTTGVFDILHRGHLNILTQAAALGDLIVGIMTDQGVENAKGARPILTLEEREAQIRSLPFVSQVIHYSDPDQRANYATVRPDIVVQGDDWLFSADRAAALTYLQENRIRLVLLPRTAGISSTEIRRRVERSGRRDESFLRERLRMIPIEDLRRYEAHEDAKVARLVAKITADRVFFNPISVVREMVVIDGANRLEALRQLGARVAPCVTYDYSDVDLLGNVHFLNNGIRTRLSEFAREEGERVEFPRRTPADILEAAESGQLIPNGETFHRLPHSVIRLPIPLEALIHDTGFDLGAEVDRRIRNGQIRYFQSAVYVCDEW
jgi:glycerol-3-phosphate cytidylyltransferase